MTKPIKVTLWTVGGIIGVCVITIAVLLNIVFSKEKLTSIINEHIHDYVTCDAHIGEVELTFFSTFPNFAININDVLLINADERFKNDTLLNVKKLVGILNVKSYLNDEKIDINEFRLQDGMVNLFVTHDSIANYDIVPPSEETSESSSFSLNEIDLKDVKLEHIALLYDNQADNLYAQLDNANLNISGSSRLQEPSGIIKTDLYTSAIVYRDSLCNVRLQNLSIPTCNAELKDTTLIKLQLSSSVEKTDFALNGSNNLALSLGRIDAEQLMVCLENSALAAVDVKLGLDTIALTMPDADGLQLAVSHADITIPNASMNEALEAIFSSNITNAWMKTQSNGVLVKNIPLSAAGQVKVSKDMNEIELKDAKLTVAKEVLKVNAELTRIDSTFMQIYSELSLAPTTFDNLLSLAPDVAKKALKGIDIKGNLSSLLAKVNIAIEDKQPINIENFEIETNLSKLAFKQNDKMAATAKELAFNAKYPVENAKMESQKQEQQIKRQKATNNKRRSKNVATSSFMSAKLSGETLHFEQHDSSEIVADLPHAAFNCTLSDEILSDSQSLPFIAADFSLDHLTATADSLFVDTHNMKGTFSMADGMRGMKKYYEAYCESENAKIQMGKELTASTGPLQIEASSVYDYGQKDLLLRYNPLLNVTLADGYVKMQKLPYPFNIPSIDFDFNLGKFKIREGILSYGDSDFKLTGEVNNLREYLKKESDLLADLKLKSTQTNVYQLMDMAELLVGAKDTTAAVAASDAELYINSTLQEHQSTEVSMSESNGADPFIVPRAIDLTLTTDIRKAIVGENEFNNLGGKLYIKDEKLILEEMGFSSKAARMQLTAIYRSPQKNNLFVGANFHLLDIEIADLIRMIPEVDTIVPMLRSFDGKAEFHLAAETNLFGNYDVKMSTLKATGAIEGKDLVLMDGETFSTISKYLMFNKKTENRIDTLSVEMALNRKKMTLYPMLIGLDKYQAVVSGSHDLTGDMPFNYHISITDCPLVGGHLGLNIDGDMKHPDDYKFHLAGCKYASLYKPEKRNVTQAQTLELKSLIGNALKSTVKQQ